METKSNHFEDYSKFWLMKSIGSLISHWNSKTNSFIRNSMDITKTYPTATFHAISALINCGFSLQNKKSIYLDINIGSFPDEKKILSSIIKKGPSRFHWVKEILKNSSHYNLSDPYQPRTAIVLERILATILYLSDGHKDIVRYGLNDCNFFIKKFLHPSVKIKFFPKPGQSPLPMLNLTLCLVYRKTIYLKLNDTLKAHQYDTLLEEIRNKVSEHINFYMARYQVPEETSFDPASLVLTLCILTNIDQEFRQSPMFRSCLKSIINSQLENGCWPSGVSISFNSTGDVVQLPSVEIVAYLVEAVIDKKVLIDNNEIIQENLKIIIPGLRKFAKYLELTYQKNISIIGSNSKIEGWSSDRLRVTEYSETWITALACRFLFRYWISEKALLRCHSLCELGLKKFESVNLTSKDAKAKWLDDIIDPDIITTPTKTLWNQFVSPILEQKQRDLIIGNPPKNHSGFIIFGPPGSGKTYLINKIAEILDWPLVELSPGHFIKNGVELIESTSKEIFEYIDNISHAIIFFDECDELFREREDSNIDGTTRTILSFATASMLPKLQKLHDKSNVLFILGTNYLSHIDKAVRRPGRFDDIILLDRQDYNGRRKYITKKIKKEVSSAIPISRINEVVKKTKNFSIQEINEFIKKTDFTSFSYPKINDTVEEYLNWCKDNGNAEIMCSRFSEVKREKIKKKWKTK